MNILSKLQHVSSAYVFFDVDDTLISVKSMLSFQDFWYERFDDTVARSLYHADLLRCVNTEASWEELNRLYYRYFAGRSVSAVMECGRDWFVHVKKELPDFFHKVPLTELKRHQDQGREVVFVSGSFPALLEPIAESVNVTHILATTMEIAGDRYTGRIALPQTIGLGKAEAIISFLQAVDGIAEDCYAYGDDISDLPMLQLVGKPTVVRGGRGLEQRAQEFGWRVISPV